MADQVILGNLVAQATQPIAPVHVPQVPLPKVTPEVKAVAPAENTSASNSEHSKQREVLLSANAASAFAQTIQTHLAYSFDKEAGSSVLKIVDSKTKKTIRQVPPEESLKLSRRIRQLLTQEAEVGSVLDEEG